MTVAYFTALGKAQPAGSKRAFRHSKTDRVMVVDANANAKPWQSVVAAAGHEAMDGQPLLEGPLAVFFAFHRPRPKGHYGTGRNSGVLRASAPAWPTGPPDLLKLARCAEDALTGVCWRDDAQIVRETMVKRYGEPARLVVRIFSISSAGVEREAGAPGPQCAPIDGLVRSTDRPAVASFPLSTNTSVSGRPSSWPPAPGEAA